MLLCTQGICSPLPFGKKQSRTQALQFVRRSSTLCSWLIYNNQHQRVIQAFGLDTMPTFWLGAGARHAKFWHWCRTLREALVPCAVSGVFDFSVL